MDFNIDLNQLIAEKAKELALEQVKSVVEKELRDYEDTLDDFVETLVEEEVDSAINNDDFSLEEAVTNGISKAIMPWIENNFYEGDIMNCIKDAILIKMQDYSLEDLIEMANSLKNK